METPMNLSGTIIANPDNDLKYRQTIQGVEGEPKTQKPMTESADPEQLQYFTE